MLLSDKGYSMLSAIYAISENDVIGKDNDIPWRLSSDLKQFKKITMGHSIIMGRKTYESIGKALPGRKNIVLTRQPDFHAPGCIVVHDLHEALEITNGEKEVFLIGGATLYQEAFEKKLVAKIYLTIVHAEIDGDVYFHLPSPDSFKIISESHHPADNRNEYPFTFRMLELLN